MCTFGVLNCRVKSRRVRELVSKTLHCERNSASVASRCCLCVFVNLPLRVFLRMEQFSHRAGPDRARTSTPGAPKGGVESKILLHFPGCGEFCQACSAPSRSKLWAIPQILVSRHEVLLESSEHGRVDHAQEAVEGKMSRRMEVVVDGGSQLAVDTTWRWSPWGQEAQRAETPRVGVALEVGGTWSAETPRFISKLAKAKARREQRLLQKRAEQAWRMRWGAIFSCATAKTVATCLLGLRCAHGSDGDTTLFSVERWRRTTATPGWLRACVS